MDTDHPSERSSTDADRPRLTALATVLALFSAVFAAATAFVYVVLEVSLGLPSSPLPIVALGVVPQLLFLAVGYLWMTRRLGRLPVAVPSARQLGVVAAGIVGAFVVQLAAELLRGVFGIATAPTVLTRLGQQSALVLWFALGAQLVLVGPAEEFLYRGALQGQLRTAFGPVASIGVPAALFGVFHLPNYVFAGVPLTSLPMWYSLGVIAASGAVFGVLFERTGNLVVPILSHALLNVVFISLTIATGV